LSDSARISPTAHYTGHVWVRNGLSHSELATAEGRLLFEAVRPTMIASRLLGGATLEPYLLARHRAIDALLEQAITEHGITQVLEVACGMSPRGWRFAERHGTRITYVEADLPGMAERKRAALERMGSLGPEHRVEVLDALRDQGPESLAAVAGELDPARGLVIITEGLLGYLDRSSVIGLWQRFATELSRFAHGRYFSDLHVGEVQTAQVRAFRLVLAGFVRGQVHLHWGTAEDARDQLQHAGFSSAELHRAVALAPQARGPGADLVHVVKAATG
jgi:O-methyltransferase involved in polyketide biosynthesis